MTAVDPLIHDELRRTAAESARRAGVEVRLARSNDELRLVSELLARVWGTTPAASPGPRNVLTAIADTGGYVAAAWQGTEMVGASFGVTYLDCGEPCLRSQVTGVLQPGHGAGEAIKRHQQQWAEGHGMRRITWTFDPLVRRNARFNLGRLGARIVRFVPDFYGSLDDGLNGADETDRCVASWEVAPLAGLEPAAGSDELRRNGHVAMLTIDEHGRPALGDLRGDLALVATPADIVALRRSDPTGATEWRRALRTAFHLAFDAGLIADLITSDGSYRFRRERPR